jgi:hypothetical protein
MAVSVSLFSGGLADFDSAVSAGGETSYTLYATVSPDVSLIVTGSQLTVTAVSS